MVVEFALAWYLKELTGSATILSTAIIVSILPTVFLAPFVGPFIDRWDRKKIIIIADPGVMLLTVLLVVLFFTGAIQIWHIYVVVFGRSIGKVFQQPAFRGAIPPVVPEKHLVRVNGLMATLEGVTILVSTPEGVFLLKSLSIHWVLSVDIITAIIAISCLLPMGIPQPLRTMLNKQLNVIGEIVQGFRFIAPWKALLFLFILSGILFVSLIR